MKGPNKSSLVLSLAYRLQLSETNVTMVLNELLHIMTEWLAEGRVVELTGFGTFSTSQRQATQVRHIRTGKPITIPARRVAVFRPGTRLKQAVRAPERTQ